MHNSKISIIVAMDEKRGIGKHNALMWKIPGELPRFKRITTGHPIIMGRKTYESIGKPLPNRVNIVITRDKDYKIEGATVVHSLDEALAVSGIAYHVSSIDNKKIPNTESQRDPVIYGTKYNIHNTNENEVFIIGGGQIFKETLRVVDRLYLTLVKGDFKADVFFPDYSDFTKVIEKEDHEESGYKFQFLTLEK